MGQKVTIGLLGTLKLSMDGTPTNRPFEVDMSFELDLEKLMEEHAITMDADPSRVQVRLDDVTLRFMLDAGEVLSRAYKSIHAGLENL